MSCGQDFKRRYCINLSDTDCNHKCMIQQYQQEKMKKQNQVDQININYNDELSKNVKLRNNYSTLKTAQARGDFGLVRSITKPFQLNNMRSQLITSNYRLANYLEQIRNIVKVNETLVNQKDKLILSKDNEIDQKNIRIRRINNQINNLQDEFLSNQQKINSGLERNQYKRNVIIILIVLIIIMTGGMAYLLIKK